MVETVVFSSWAGLARVAISGTLAYASLVLLLGAEVNAATFHAGRGDRALALES